MSGGADDAPDPAPPRPVRTFRVDLEYDGEGFCGWQRQAADRTVQATLEEALSRLVGAPVAVVGAGRTDAGVHALAQVAAFRTTADIPEKGWRMGLTSRLPPQVCVRDARVVAENFDPRRASAGKRYRYVLLTSAMRDPLVRDRAWHVHGDLDLDRMTREARDLIGVHDFRAFRAADCERETTVRQLFRVTLKSPFADRDDLVAVEVEGTAFLKNMVRIIVGTLVDVGRGKLPEGTVRERLSDGDRTLSGMTAPAHGLYLDEVFLRPEWLLPGDILRPRPDYADAPPDAPTEDSDEDEG